jgi:hypothetical protein
MARPEKVQLEVKQEVGVGRPENVFRFLHKYLQVGGTFAATLQVEASIDGSEYFNVGSAVIAPGVVPIAETVEFIRVRTTAYTSGEPKAVLAGFDERAA